MSLKIDPRDVLLYLNELGYTNISAQQLKEFIIDLKKIIKYEQRRRKHLLQNGYVSTSAGNYIQNTEISFKDYIERNKSPTRLSKPDIFETLHNQPTEAFKAKIINKRDQQPIAIHIKQTKKKAPLHEHCIHFDNLDEHPMISSKTDSDKNLTDGKKTTETSLEDEKKIESKLSTKTELETGSSRTSGVRPNSKQSQSSSANSTKFKKSKTQVLKSSASTKSINKSDPVALYHAYQKQWKTIKFPGQENHLDLRWAVREKLMDGPIVEVKRKPSAKKIAFK